MIKSNFLWNNAKTTTHILFSKAYNRAKRDSILNDMQKRGYNSAAIYWLNQGDYDGQVCPYAGGKWWSPALDLAELDRWERIIIEELQPRGIWPMFWVFGDDSPAIKDGIKNHRQDVANIIMFLAWRFDKYALCNCLALEANEYMSRDDAYFYGSILRAQSTKCLGVHQTTGRYDYMALPCFDHGVLQYGFGKKNHTAAVKDVQSLTRKAIAALGKPCIAWEYSRYGESKEARACGDAAIAAGACGYGNGGS